MPRGPRLDYPGFLHHIIVRGFDKQKIFINEIDYTDFLSRIETVLDNSGACIYAWVLMPDHLHLLLKTGKLSLSTIMRRILTGYAVSFNRRHHRSGYLYQGRYKSVVCEEEPYLLELVKYIHLNPLRASIISSYEELDRYRWCGHSVIMGNQEALWQDRQKILTCFGETLAVSKIKYRECLFDAMQQGNRPELLGGGLIRSMGGIGNIQFVRSTDEKQEYDQRILGSSDFVESVLSRIEPGRTQGRNISMKKLIGKIARYFKVTPDELLLKNRHKDPGKAKAVLVAIGISEVKIPGTVLAKKLSLSKSSISKLNRKGDEILKKQEGLMDAILGDKPMNEGGKN